MQKNQAREAAKSFDPSSFLDARSYLHALFEDVKAEDPKYSFTAFAKELGFAPSNIMHQLIKGHRPLTVKTMRRIATALNVRGLQRRYLIGLVTLANATKAGEKEETLEYLLELKEQMAPAPLDRDRLAYYEKWYHPVIREMTRMDEFRSDPQWIAKNLVPRVRPSDVEESLKLLERLGMIEFDAERNRHVPRVEHSSTGSEVAELALLKYHSELMEAGRSAIPEADPHKRDISSVTLCLSEGGIRKVKALLHELQMALVAEDKKSQSRAHVYQVNLQMVPLTKSRPGDDSDD